MEFPDSPTIGQEYVFEDMRWQWNGVGWVRVKPYESVTSVNAATGDVVLDYSDVGAEQAFSKGDLVAGSGVSFSGTGTGRLVGSGSLTINSSAGGGNIPIDIQNGAYTLVAGDIGRMKAKNVTTAYTYTINTSVFSAGDVVYVGNFANTHAITLAQGSGFTLRLAGSTTTGNRSLGPRGIATVMFVSATEAYVYGVGVG